MHRQAIAVPAQGQVETFKPFELSTILWSYGKMSLANRELCSCPALEVLADHPIRRCSASL